MEEFRLVILTPYGKYLDTEVSFLEVRNDKYSLGITKSHAPIISTVGIEPIKIRMKGSEFIYACGGGIINIDKEKVTLVINSIERSDEIDLDRALQAKKRAEDRLNSKTEEIDTARAQASLARALQRIHIKQGN